MINSSKIKKIFILFFWAIFFNIFPATRQDYFDLYNEIIKSKDWDKGTLVYKKAINEYPDEYWFYIYLNVFLKNQKEYESALKILEQAKNKFDVNREIIENYKWTVFEYGWYEVEKKNFLHAYKLFSEAYKLDPEDQWIINAYGYILRETGRIDESINILENGIIKFKNNNYIRDNLLYAYIKKAEILRENNLDACGEFLKKAEKINPDNETLLFSYGYFLRLKKNFRDSLNIYSRGLSLYPENEYFPLNIKGTYYEFADFLSKDNKYNEATNIMLEAIMKFPDEIWFHGRLYEYYYKMEDYSRSAEFLLNIAKIIKNKSVINQDGINIQNFIFINMSQILNKYAYRNLFKEGFLIIDRLDKYISDKYIIFQLRGGFLYHAGKKDDGLDLVYEAYDEYIKYHQEYKNPIIEPLPLRGTYLVGGNSRMDAITHAGMNRFCFDFIGSTEGGKLTKTDIVGFGKNEDYIGFGLPIYSTTSGEIIDVEDNYEDLKPSGEYRLLDGNYMTIKDAKGFLHVFVHIKSKSALVKKGDRVNAGDIIAELGNTGMTSIPHLHYGIYSPDWVVSIPVVFLDYNVINSDGTTSFIRKGVPQDKSIISIK